MRAGPSEQRNILGSPGSESWSHETRMSPLYGLALCCIAAASWGAPVFAADSYTITRLPVPSGYNYVIPAGINDSGQVTGYYGAGNGTDRAFRWSATAGYETLFPQTGVSAFGVSINAAGNVLVTRSPDTFVWRSPGDVTVLEKGGFQQSGGIALSDSGHVAGYVVTSGNAYPVVWDSANNLTYIEYPPRVGQATDINASGVTIGSLDRVNGKAFVWSEAGGLTLFPERLGYTQSGIRAINNAGVIAGQAIAPGFSTASAFLWTETNGFQDLDIPPVSAINDLNVVIGNHQNSCFMWDSINGRRDLNTLGDFVGWELQEAIGMSNQGLIVGRGRYQGVPASFVLTPVPEPSTAILLGASLGVGLWCLRRRSPAEDC